MKRSDIKSHCPINIALETIGDAWSLLIIRDIVYYGKKTFGEFLTSEEGISTNILASRLHQLVEKGLLVKSSYESDKRKEWYMLSEKGLDLIPILLEMADWGAKHDPETNAEERWINSLNTTRDTMIGLIRATVQEGGSIFEGSNSVIRKLQEGSST